MKVRHFIKLTSKIIFEKLTEFVKTSSEMDSIRNHSWKIRIEYFPTFNEYLDWEKQLFFKKNGNLKSCKFKRLNKFRLKDGNIIRGITGRYPLDVYFHVITNSDDTEIINIIPILRGSQDAKDFNERVGKYGAV